MLFVDFYFLGHGDLRQFTAKTRRPTFGTAVGRAVFEWGWEGKVKGCTAAVLSGYQGFIQPFVSGGIMKLSGRTVTIEWPKATSQGVSSTKEH